tara:strand:+ start:381 stop:863 length:483 start_codon:yes stop_codon:yes gene_type:complete
VEKFTLPSLFEKLLTISTKMRYNMMKDLNKITFTARKGDMKKLIQNFLALAFTNFEENGKKKLLETSANILESKPEMALTSLEEYIEEIEEYRQHLKAVYELTEEHLFLESNKVNITFPAGEPIPMDEINARIDDSTVKTAEKKKQIKDRVKSKKSKEEK